MKIQYRRWGNIYIYLYIDIYSTTYLPSQRRYKNPRSTVPKVTPENQPNFPPLQVHVHLDDDFGASNVHTPASHPFLGETSTNGSHLGERIALAKLVRYVSGFVQPGLAATGSISYRSTIMATNAWISAADRCRPGHSVEPPPKGR